MRGVYRGGQSQSSRQPKCGPATRRRLLAGQQARHPPLAPSRPVLRCQLPRLLQGHSTDEVPTFALWRRCRVDISRAVGVNSGGTRYCSWETQVSKSSSAAVSQAQASPSTKHQDMCMDVTSTRHLAARAAPARAAPARHGTAWAWSGPCQKETRTGAAVVPCIDWLGALVALLRCFRECLFAPLCARSVDSIGAPSACCARPVRRCEHPRAHPLLASAPRLASSLQTPTLAGGTCIAADIDNCSESKPVRPISTASSMR